MSEQITSETMELTAPRMEYAVRLIEGSAYLTEQDANDAVTERVQAGWSLASAELAERSSGGYFLMLWFEREVQP